MLFKNILVPVDLSERSLKALRIAVDMVPRNEKAWVTLLHVIEVIDGASDDEFADFYEKLSKRAEKKMAAIAEEYSDEKLTIEKRIVLGKRVQEIVRFAAENETDLIILSSHKIEKLDPSEGWATISYRVSILSPCPVMMVK
ncbi:MAG: universal stress protein [Pseudomonadota bacterium]